MHELLRSAVLVLGASVVVLLVCHRLRLPPLVGLLLSGVLIGPSGLGLISRQEEVEVLAEIGVVLLLFSIGLEFDLARLRGLGRAFLAGGAAQATFTSLAAAGVALAAGVPPRTALFLGWVIALSSTAVVFKIYAERRETTTPHGQTAVGILLFQDLLVVPFLALVPLLAGTRGVAPSAIAIRLGGAILAAAALVAVARFVTPALLRRFVGTRVREILLLGALALCLALAWATETLGLGLALGAFLAGLLIAETEYRTQVIADVGPLRDVLTSLFFLSVGMLVDLSFLARHAVPIATLAIAILIGKSVIAAAATMLLRLPLRTAVLVGAALAPVGEFAFVLLRAGHEFRLVDPFIYQVLLASILLTLLASPGLISVAPQVARWLARFERRPLAEEPGETAQDHVVIVGYGVSGQLLARVLSSASIRHRVVELNGALVRRARMAGEPVLFGDAVRREVLEEAGVERARVLVLAISDPEASRRVVEAARQLNPDLRILVRSRQVREIEELRKRGADDVIADEFETAIELFTRVLASYHVPRNVIRAETRALRGEGYEMLRAPRIGEGVSDAVLSALEAGTTDLYRIAETSPATGATLRSLDLRGRTGATVIAVVHGDAPETNPSPDRPLAAGDCLVLVGSHAEIESAFQALGRGMREEAEPARAEPTT